MLSHTRSIDLPVQVRPRLTFRFYEKQTRVSGLHSCHTGCVPWARWATRTRYLRDFEGNAVVLNGLLVFLESKGAFGKLDRGFDSRVGVCAGPVGTVLSWSRGSIGECVS
jgi:hypothetical protein